MSSADINADLETGLFLFPTSERPAQSSGGLYIGWGTADVCDRACVDVSPEMILLDEPSMGLAPQLVEEIFDIVKDLNEKEGVSFLLAEQNTNLRLRYAHYGYILESGRVVMDGACGRTARKS